MTWHQWHHTAPMSSRMGLSSLRAREKASSPHSCQPIGWCAAERKYGLAESLRRLPGWLVKMEPFPANCSLQNTGPRGILRPRLSGRRETRSLDGVRWPRVARVERLASGKPFLLAMIKANAVFAEPPAEIHV